MTWDEFCKYCHCVPSECRCGGQKYDVKRYGTGGVVLEARFYTFEELRQILQVEERMNRHLEQAMQEVKKVINK